MRNGEHALRVPRLRVKRAIGRVLPRAVRGYVGEALARARLRAVSVLNDPLQIRRPTCDRTCPICGYRGEFWSFGSPPRAEALCPDCFSLERHRLLQLLFARMPRDLTAGKRVLHFAPEGFVRDCLAPPAAYVTTDISRRGVDCHCAMESLPFPNGSFDAVIANHVLEHVADEARALREIRRVVTDAASVILSVPLIHAWDTTYEDERIRVPEERRVHFGQHDHLRFYGRDFAARLHRAGFDVEVFQMDPRSEIQFGLRRGDQLFIARPQAGAA